MDLLRDAFDWHDWRFDLCDTPEKAGEKIAAYGIIGKRIRSAFAIGSMREPELWWIERSALETAGVPSDVISARSFPYREDILVPLELELCEPVVIVFEDDTTLELQLVNGGQLRMSVNQSDPDVRDGTNHSDFDGESLFSRLRGHVIRDVEHHVRRITSTNVRRGRPETYVEVKWEFELDGTNGFFLYQQSYEGWFTFGIDQRRIRDWFGSMTERISLRDWQAAMRPRKQVMIVEGHDAGGYFWIMPVRQNSEGKSDLAVTEYRPEEISIDELDVNDYLRYYLEKYFDPDFPYTCRTEDSGPGFEWNLEYNLYTYDTMNAMLAEMEVSADRLEAVPELSQANRSWYRGDPDVLVDFYRRFIHRLRRMMEHAPEYDLISFMGP